MRIRRFPPTTGSLSDGKHLTVFVSAFSCIETHLNMSSPKSQLVMQKRHFLFFRRFFIEKNERFIIDKSPSLWLNNSTV